MKRQNNLDDVKFYYPESIIEPYLNKDACLNPGRYVGKACNGCGYEEKCIYKSKYKYKKLS